MQSSRIEIYMCSFPLTLIGILIRLVMKSFSKPCHTLLWYACSCFVLLFLKPGASTLVLPFLRLGASTLVLLLHYPWGINPQGLFPIPRASTLCFYCFWGHEHQLWSYTCSTHKASIPRLVQYSLFRYARHQHYLCSVSMLSHMQIISCSIASCSFFSTNHETQLHSIFIKMYHENISRHHFIVVSQNI